MIHGIKSIDIDGMIRCQYKKTLPHYHTSVKQIKPTLNPKTGSTCNNTPKHHKNCCLCKMEKQVFPGYVRPYQKKVQYCTKIGKNGRMVESAN